jgi:hypothetical protein
VSEPQVGNRVLTDTGKIGLVVERGTRLSVPIAHVLLDGALETCWYYLTQLEVIVPKSSVT